VTAADLPVPIDWSAFWAQDRTAEDFVVAPLLARGRQHSMYAGHKDGKSLLAQEITAALGTGRAVLDRPAGVPVNVGYLDMEMGDDDLHERLTDLGYGPKCDLSHLHYWSLPSLPALDTEDGGDMVMALIAEHDLEVVVFDTFSRVVHGGENDADTVRAFYRHTGARLKAAGVTSLRLDHAGKDPDRGARGSSSKGDDVDVVWEFTKRTAGAIRLRATAKRVPWVPDEINLTLVTEPRVRHQLAQTTAPAGTAEAAALLDRLNVPDDATAAVATAALRAADCGRRKEVVLAALKLRRDRP
jgi:hypothetical protein